MAKAASPSKSVVWSQYEIPGLSLTKQERDAVLASSSKGFALLASILEAKLKAVQKERCSQDQYDSPAWGYKQAGLNEAERTLQGILSLLDEVKHRT